MSRYSLLSGRLGFLVAVGAVTGLIASRLGIPLAWMVGPMLSAAALSLGGWNVPVPRALRSSGQIIVASSVGLHFTPAAVAEVTSQAPYMIGGALATIVAGYASAILLMRIAQTDPATAIFAGIPGGPVEMAQMAEQAGGDGAAVALAQTLRIAAIVLIIPPLLLWQSEGVPFAGGLASHAPASPPGLLLLAILAIGAGLAFRRLRIANPFFLGPLALSATLAATDSQLSPVPQLLVAAGQVLLGISLGVRFDRALLGRAPRFVAAAFATTALLLGCCAALALGIGWLSGHSFAQMALATAPGSVTEMALTADGLGLGVASVTAYHIIRIFVIIPLSPQMIRLMPRQSRKESLAEQSID